jgi:hypothetical protein
MQFNVYCRDILLANQNLDLWELDKQATVDLQCNRDSKQRPPQVQHNIPLERAIEDRQRGTPDHDKASWIKMITQILVKIQLCLW